MSRIAEEIKALAWTLGGTALVLITLSGQTRTYGLVISGIAFVVHLVATIFSSDE
jgi:hypothetical protein